MTFAFDFDGPHEADKDTVGGKGAGLATMTSIGLPVPPGFTLTTAACQRTLAEGSLPAEVWEETVAAIHRLEARTGRSFGGDTGTPLLVSVRSGAKFSMPGMMDTVLNLGITERAIAALAEWSGREHFAGDVARRFVQTYGGVVLGVDSAVFQHILTDLRQRRGVSDDSGLTVEDLAEARRRFIEALAAAGASIPADPYEQLRNAISAVFNSWNSRRAIDYRRLNDIPDTLGTACNVQIMVFGDLGDDSGTGVCFTRDPSTGERVAYGDYLSNAQGEDVVAGIRHTLPIADMAVRHPDQHAELLAVMATLERQYRDMCDIEFTIERDKLWILQTRVGKRAAVAAVRMAVEMANEGLIDRNTALGRIQPSTLVQILHPRLEEQGTTTALIATGLNASPGAARGHAVFDADRAAELDAAGTPVILVRWETSPSDIHGMVASQGILTSHGGLTSHAAVVARGMGLPAVTGASSIDVDVDAKCFRVGNVVVREGDLITIDGGSGKVYLGGLTLASAIPSPELDVLLGWADEVRTLGVRANADDGLGAREAVRWGADGIGLARTEHMFMGERLPVVRRVILDDDPTALDTLEKLQANDFEDLLAAMDGKPVVVRLLDPPLHEFFPSRLELVEDRIKAVAAGGDTGEIDRMIEAVKHLEESNPMMGMRGVRLGVMRPELYRAQVRAALEAIRRRVTAGGDPHLELMIPLISTGSELARMEAMIRTEAANAGIDRDIPVGTMIEIPRAALRAAELAEHARFFSFGTNDLTQMTFGISRDDAQKSFLGHYLELGLLTTDPFVSVDVDGVGRLIEIATREGRAARPDLEVGICGEHGGDPETIAFCHRIGLDYVSCSPPRVPIARLAAAHAALGIKAEQASL